MMQGNGNAIKLGMISEFLFTLLEAPHARHGWRPVAEQAAIRSRCRRHAMEWGTHLAICREIVRLVAESCPSKRTVVVLGSGLLLDVPIDDLCRLFENVVLVDLHHPSEARAARKRHSNLELRHADVTAPGFWESLGDDADFLCSLNLAAQLALGEGRDSIVLDHIAGLKSRPGTRLMISERERVELDENGGEIACESALPKQADLEPPEKSWKWHLAPMGELAPYRSLVLDVGAWVWRS